MGTANEYDKTKTWEGGYILEISIGGVDLNAVVLVEGHAPESVILCLSRNVELLPEFVRCLHGLMSTAS